MRPPRTPLDALLRARGISNRRLAALAQVNPNAVAHWRTGRHRPGESAAEAVAHVLGVSIERLFPPPTRASQPPARTALEAAMRATGTTAAAVAEQAGVTADTVHRWKRGRVIPQLPAARRVAQILGQPLEQVWPEIWVGQRRVRSTSVDQPDSEQSVSGRELLTVEDVLAASGAPEPDALRRAACAQPKAKADWWWPPNDSDGIRARRICARCPVVGNCRDTFLSHPELDDSGIWAGLPGHVLRAAALATSAADHGEASDGR